MVQAGMVMLWEFLPQRLTEHVLCAGSWTRRQTWHKEISSSSCGYDKEEKSKTGRQEWLGETPCTHSTLTKSLTYQTAESSREVPRTIRARC